MSEPVGNAPRSPSDIPSNSHKSQETAVPAAKKEEKEPVEKIIEGTVTTRKQPWWKRIARNMVAEDAQHIGDFLLVDVIVPAVKNLIRDLMVGGTDRVLFGQSKARRDVGLGLGGNVRSLRTRYDQMSEEPSRRTLSREARARHDFDDVVLDNRAEAIEVIEALISRVVRYGGATVADLYDLVGVTGSYADQRWGWTDLATADVRQFRGGWLLDLPRPEPIH